MDDLKDKYFLAITDMVIDTNDLLDLKNSLDLYFDDHLTDKKFFLEVLEYVYLPYLKSKSNGAISVLLKGFDDELFVFLNKWIEEKSTQAKRKGKNNSSGRKAKPRKKFLELINADKRENFKKHQQNFINTFKDSGGKELAYSCLALNQLGYIKESNFKNISALHESYVINFLGSKSSPKGFGDYFKPHKIFDEDLEEVKSKVVDILL